MTWFAAMHAKIKAEISKMSEAHQLKAVRYHLREAGRRHINAMARQGDRAVELTNLASRSADH